MRGCWDRLLLLQLVFFGIASAAGIGVVRIAECEANKYFWKDDAPKPREFYACLTVKGRAVHMRCSEGSYMCKTGAEEFEPCACSDDPDEENQVATNAANIKSVKKKAKDHAKQADEDGDYDYSDVNDADDDDDEYYDVVEDADDTGDNQAESDTDDGQAGYRPRPDTNVAAQDNTDPPTLGHGPVATDPPVALTFESLPATGCPDQYKLSPNTHMYNGKLQSQYTDLIACQRACLQETRCLGVDWNKQPTTPNDGRCFFIFPESTRFGLDAYHDYCCDHFRRTNCIASTPQVTPPLAPVTPATGNGETGAGPDAGDAPNLGHYNRPPAQYPGAGKSGAGNDQTNPYFGMEYYKRKSGYFQGNYPGDTDESTDNGATDSPAVSETATESTVSESTTDPVIVTTSQPDVTTTIPDSGCPFTFEEFNTTSHPFGVNVTVGDFNDEVEECKYWCLVRSFCEAVDFNTNTHTCYYVPEVNPPLAATVTGVTHFRKVECAPPLMCWEGDTVLTTKDDLSVTDPETAQTQCFGVCFVRQVKQDGATVVQRGCVTVVDKEAPPAVGCSNNRETMSMTCYCDTARCNGLSLQALANQMLYLPLDGDLSDHSGIGHDGVVPTGFTEPKFTCLDKATNCSALFIGSQCITVESLARTKWGAADNATLSFVPQASFAVWFKRMATAASKSQGIFGNSVDDRVATWRIIAQHRPNYIGGGVLTDGATFKNIDDYEYKLAYDGQWHLAVLTYNGVRNVSTGQFPVLRLYIDGMLQTGNAQADTGEIEIRDQPVTIGCVNGQNFVGFIDEARIFSTALEPRDIEAMIAMRDTSHYYQGIADKIEN